MGIFGNGNANGSTANGAGPSQFGGVGGGAGNDLMDGFGGLDLNTNSGQPPPPGQQLNARKNNEDILGLF